MRETREGNRFWQPTLWFTPYLLGDRQFTHRNLWEVEVLLESKERANHSPPVITTSVSRRIADKLFQCVWPFFVGWRLKGYHKFCLCKTITRTNSIIGYLRAGQFWVYEDWGNNSYLHVKKLMSYLNQYKSKLFVWLTNLVLNKNGQNHVGSR